MNRCSRSRLQFFSVFLSYLQCKHEPFESFTRVIRGAHIDCVLSHHILYAKEIVSAEIFVVLIGCAIPIRCFHHDQHLFAPPPL